MWIDSKWTDSEGNVWYKTFGENSSGIYSGDHWQELDKISKSGVWERELTTLEPECAATCWRQKQSNAAYPLVYDPTYYPTKVDPKDTTYSFLHNYRILYRTGD